VVLSTTRYAADADYRLFIVEDCCADTDPAVHDFLHAKIFPRQADVVQSSLFQIGENPSSNTLEVTQWTWDLKASMRS